MKWLEATIDVILLVFGHLVAQPVSILPIQAQERARSVELIRCEIVANGRKPLVQFFPIAPVPSVSETTEPLITMRLC